MIENLILVAGPSSSGKSTFFNKLSAQALPQISSVLEFEGEQAWQRFKLTHWALSKMSPSKRVWGEYTFTRPWIKDTPNVYANDSSLDILTIAQHLVMVTIWVEPTVLARRFVQRQRSRILSSLQKGKLKSALSAWEVLTRVSKLYKRPEDLLLQYKTWFAYCSTHNPQAHWILDNTKATALYPLGEWPRLAAR